jgi:predicted metalloprotease with PDZ domain
VGDGKPLRVMQPIEMPDGVSYEGVFGEQPTHVPESIAKWGLSVALTVKGNIRVGKVAEGGEAARAGVAPKAKVVSVNGTKVNDLIHMEGLLLQARGPEVKVVFDPGGEVVLPMP